MWSSKKRSLLSAALVVGALLTGTVPSAQAKTAHLVEINGKLAHMKSERTGSSSSREESWGQLGAIRFYGSRARKGHEIVLEGPVSVRSTLHGHMVTVDTLRLVAVGDEEDTWYIPRDEVERLAQIAGIELPDPLAFLPLILAALGVWAVALTIIIAWTIREMRRAAAEPDRPAAIRGKPSRVTAPTPC